MKLEKQKKLGTVILNCDIFDKYVKIYRKNPLILVNMSDNIKTSRKLT